MSPRFFRFMFVPIAFFFVASAVLPAAAQTTREAAELNMRVDRLEAQIRDLTGQIERLTFALQNAGQGTAPSIKQQQQVAPQVQPNNGLGAPPSNLGTLSDASGGPLDLSALINGSGGIGIEPQQQNGVRQAIQPAVSAAASTPRDEYELAYGHILRGDYDIAEASLREFLTKYPTDPLVSDARFWLGETKFVRGNFREAANEFLESYSKYPQGAKAPDSLLKLGLSLKELGETDAACATYAELVRKYPAASPPVKERVRTERKSAKCI
ncbi:MAG: tol-pal system protein YbgF [Hyphomicrobiales bacterium]